MHIIRILINFFVPNLRNSKQIDFFRRALAKLRKAK